MVSIHTMAIDTFVPMLRTLSACLEKGAEHARAKSFDASVLVNARLAPDMFTLAQQVQIACDHAKNGVARLTGQEPPRFPDDEKTLEELKARIAKTIAYLESAPANAFSGAEERKITVSLPGDLVLEIKGGDYLRDWALPHFYFHVVTAYDILRHNGVALGKRDYLAHVGRFIHKRDAA